MIVSSHQCNLHRPRSAVSGWSVLRLVVTPRQALKAQASWVTLAVETV